MDAQYDDTDPFLPPVAAVPHQPVRRGHGRPRGNLEAARTGYVTIRVLPSEKARLAAAAGRAGCGDTSAWARGLLLGACGGGDAPAPLGREALAEVARLRRDLNSGVGANLNQAMLHANAMAKAGRAVDAEALASVVEEAEAAVDAMRATLQRLLRPGSA